MFPSKTAILSGGASTVFPNTYSLEFDGTNDYLNCGNDSSLQLGTADFTISAWIYRTSSGHTAIMGYGDDVGNEENWRFRVKNIGGGDTLEFLANDGSTSVTVLGSATITEDEWNHVAFSWDRDSATGAQFYFNGSADGSGQNMTTVGDLDHSSDGLLIGVRPSGSNPTGNPWSGNLDEVAMWNSALSAGSISNIYNNGVPTDLNADSNSGNLVGWWRMGDGTLDDGNVAGNGLIADQTNATLGSELFDSDASAFTAGGTYSGSGSPAVTDCYGWTVEGSNTIANVSNALAITYVDNVSGARGNLNNATDLSTDLTVDQLYKLTVDASYSGGSSGVKIRVWDGAATYQYTSVLTTSTVNYSIYFIPKHVSYCFILLSSLGASNVVTLDNLSLKEVNGNPGLMVSFDGSDIVTDTP